MISRPQFDDACKAYIVKHANSWVWNEHPTWPGFGYLSRSTVHTRRSQPTLETETIEDLDEATGSTDIEPLTCQQYIIYSAIFQVPTFYFTMHDSQGAPLSLNDILCTTLFRPFGFGRVEKSGFGLTLPMSSFPLLSQGDHPTLGTPSWYLHPCETATAVRELLEERGSEEGVNVIEIWMLIVENVIELNSC